MQTYKFSSKYSERYEIQSKNYTFSWNMQDFM